VHVQRLAIETTKYADHMHIVADVLAYDEDEILWDVETSYDDYNGQGYNYQARDGSDGNYFTGVRALFAVIGPSNPIYVQNFYVEWR